MKKIPIWVQDFKKLITNRFFYVDKTKEIIDLVNQNWYYFLPRPRRFGKSLLCSTMKYLFLGEKELFRWLYAENNWDWQDWYPVIYIDFAGWASMDILEDYIAYNWHLLFKDSRNIVDIKLKNISHKFNKIQYIIENVYEKFKKQVVILIDEYDRPVLNVLNDVKKAEDLRLQFRDFYSWIKAIDSQIRLFFLTWITKILKMSIFSVLNNLQDLFYDPLAYKIVWYTEEELKKYFAEELKEAAEFNWLEEEILYQEIKKFYNWYNFGNPKDRIYNPWDMNNFILKKQFGMYWSSTWLPSAIEEYISKRNVDVKGLIDDVYSWNLIVNETDLNLENLNTISEKVLLLTGWYLTVKEKFGDEMICNFPNLQVEKVVTNYLLKLALDSRKFNSLQIIARTLVEGIKNVDLEQIKEAVEWILETVNNASYERWKRNPEWWLKTLILLTINLKLDFAIGEKHTLRNRNDIFLKVNWNHYVIEVKVNKSKKELLKAMKEYKKEDNVVIWILWDSKKDELIIEKI